MQVRWLVGQYKMDAVVLLINSGCAMSAAGVHKGCRGAQGLVQTGNQSPASLTSNTAGTLGLQFVFNRHALSAVSVLFNMAHSVTL